MSSGRVRTFATEISFGSERLWVTAYALCMAQAWYQMIGQGVQQHEGWPHGEYRYMEQGTAARATWLQISCQGLQSLSSQCTVVTVARTLGYSGQFSSVPFCFRCTT